MKENVHFNNSKGDTLSGVLSDSTEGTDTPVVILCHGFTSSKESRTYVTLEKELNEKGIAALRFDFFAYGESEGEFAKITVSEGVDDVLQALAFLKERGYTSIGLLGSSYGGSVAINAAAAATDELRFLILKSPVVNWSEKIFHNSEQDLEEWKERGWWEYTSKSSGKKYKLNYSFVEDFSNSDGYEKGKNITIPTLLVHGDQDTSVPVEQSIKLDSILPNSTLVVFSGTDHHYSKQEDFDHSIELFVDFVVKHAS